MFFFNFNDFQIIGASPEILVRLRDNQITIRPIAGTRPRGKTLEEDRFYEKDLLKDKKELSEHLMLLDLGRNDVGKVSKINTVKVTEKFKIEKYSHVMHIVSNVVGSFDKKQSLFDTMLAGFPAGTVTGAPKIRAMEIIDELEKSKRKVYAGGIGYFSANGDFDTCIALRTAISKNNKTKFEEGMIVSNEPGYYEKNKFGIRIENLIYVKKIKNKKFFENLTMAPIDKNLINQDLLSENERNWINDHHKKVFINLKDSMNKREILDLKDSCSAI